MHFLVRSEVVSPFTLLFTFGARDIGVYLLTTMGDRQFGISYTSEGGIDTLFFIRIIGMEDILRMIYICNTILGGNIKGCVIIMNLGVRDCTFFNRGLLYGFRGFNIEYKEDHGNCDYIFGYIVIGIQIMSIAKVFGGTSSQTIMFITSGIHGLLTVWNYHGDRGFEQVFVSLLDCRGVTMDQKKTLCGG